MNLVIYTTHYPYSNGEKYLEEEIRVAEKKFDNILIVSYAKRNEELNQYVPHNAKVVTIREKTDSVTECCMLLKHLFCVRVWKELLEGCKERGFSKATVILKKILTTERHVAYLQCNEHYWFTGAYIAKETVYYSYWLSSAALYLVRKKKFLNGICVARAHGCDCFYSREFIPWRKQILSKLDAIFPVSQIGCLDILEHFGHILNGLANKICVARLGVALPINIRGEADRSDELDNYVDAVTIVSCSNIIALKRLDLLIDALSLCDFVDIHWIHFGDGILMKRIKSYAGQKLNNKKNISYTFFGRVMKEEILKYYSKHRVNLFINCSDAEGIPVSAMEAMSYGIPVIARNVGGNAELVDNNNGFLLPETITPGDLATAIKTVLFNEDGILYKQRCDNAYYQIAIFYSAAKNYDNFYRRIQKTLNV